MWGKSPRCSLATSCTGKPYGLKDQIYLKGFAFAEPGAARSFRGVGRLSPVAMPGLDK